MNILVAKLVIKIRLVTHSLLTLFASLVWKVLDTGPKEELSRYRLAFPLFDEISQIISMTVTFVLLTKINGFTKRTKHLI